MPANGPVLVALTLASVGLLLFLILYVKLHAAVALLLTSMTLGLAAGMAPEKVLKSIQAGFGEALGFIAVVVALGAMIGRLLEHAGGGRALADWLLQIFGKERAAWAILIAAFLVGLPIFFEVGLIILIPVIWNLARESKRSLLFYGIPVISALTMTHALVPPHPAPSAAAQLLGADLGRTILYGVMISFPLAILGGILCGGFVARRMFIPVPEMAQATKSPEAGENPPPLPVVILILLAPVLLIFAATLWPKIKTLAFLGHPFAALSVTLLLALIFFGVMRGLKRGQILKLTTEAMEPIGTLLVIMGAGGAFKQIIVDCGVGPYAGNLLTHAGVSPLIVGYVIGAAMRIAQGSATVAIITAAGIVAPLVKGIPGYRPEMIVMAVCCGGTVLSHVNDSGFWMINQFFGMTVPQTLKSWSIIKVIMSIAGFGLLLLLQAILGG